MQRALEGLPGAISARVSLARERAIVDYDPRALTIARMVEAIGDTVVLPAARRAIERASRPRRGRPSR
ncbi:MAG: heavy-metal-associated domain-containing protein [candidate division NC10 bacterium]|nr:heavy-metal-associated domain-containing protein [candidate division NC10 bacterium]MBI2457265.1 heavy-metal-associated domain-containing protein [candidate division NC10 bacterium]